MIALLRCLLSLLLLTSHGCAAQPREEVPLFSQAELDQMLAPIALYPDQLLSQVLMAATYPLEVVQAARWSREHPGLQGQEAVRAVDDRAWDPSVKSLVAFPELLAQMDADLDWTERLGDAFLAQQQQVMDTIQDLRERAYAAGNLRSGEQVQVIREREVIYVRPAYPDIVYVPYYDPFTVYGTWWWPHYRPAYWAPWPGYVTLGYASHGGYFWGAGVNLGVSFFYSDWDWQDHYVRVVDYRPFYYSGPPYVQHIWVHDYRHRRGVPYRHHALERRFVPADAPPVRRHDYGDERDLDRDYRYRYRADDHDGGPTGRVRGAAPSGAPLTPVSTSPAPRAEPGAAPLGGTARAARSREEGARPTPTSETRGVDRSRQPTPARTPSAPVTSEGRNGTGAPRDAERPRTTPAPGYRAPERPAPSRTPERIEPRVEQRSVRPETRSAPLERYPAPQTREAPQPRYPTPAQPPRQSRPEAPPAVRSAPQAAPQRAAMPSGGGFSAPDRAARDPSFGGGSVQRVELPQPRHPEPRSQPAGGESRRMERDGGGDGGGFRRGEGGSGERGPGRERP